MGTSARSPGWVPRAAGPSAAATPRGMQLLQGEGDAHPLTRPLLCRLHTRSHRRGQRLGSSVKQRLFSMYKTPRLGGGNIKSCAVLGRAPSRTEAPVSSMGVSACNWWGDPSQGLRLWLQSIGGIRHIPLLAPTEGMWGVRHHGSNGGPSRAHGVHRMGGKWGLDPMGEAPAPIHRIESGKGHGGSSNWRHRGQRRDLQCKAGGSPFPRVGIAQTTAPS